MGYLNCLPKVCTNFIYWSTTPRSQEILALRIYTYDFGIPFRWLQVRSLLDPVCSFLFLKSMLIGRSWLEVSDVTFEQRFLWGVSSHPQLWLCYICLQQSALTSFKMLRVLLFVDLLFHDFVPARCAISVKSSSSHHLWSMDGSVYWTKSDFTRGLVRGCVILWFWHWFLCFGPYLDQVFC